jgi:hypothetical protein
MPFQFHHGFDKIAEKNNLRNKLFNFLTVSDVFTHCGGEGMA